MIPLKMNVVFKEMEVSYKYIM